MKYQVAKAMGSYATVDKGLPDIAGVYQIHKKLENQRFDWLCGGQ